MAAPRSSPTLRHGVVSSGLPGEPQARAAPHPAVRDDMTGRLQQPPTKRQRLLHEGRHAGHQPGGGPPAEAAAGNGREGRGAEPSSGVEGEEAPESHAPPVSSTSLLPAAGAPPPAAPSAPAHLTTPTVASLAVAPLHFMADAVFLTIAAGSPAGGFGPLLATDRQHLLATAIILCFGPGCLKDLSVFRVLQSQRHGNTSSPSSSSSSSSSPSMQLLLLIGAVFCLPDDEVAAILPELGMQRGEEEAMLQARLRLLAWAIDATTPGVASAGSSGGAPRQPGRAEVLFMLVRAGPELEARVDGLADAIPLLLAAFQQVQQIGRALVAVAACLAHAQQVRIGTYAGAAGEEMRVVGQMMRVLGRAAEDGGGSGSSGFSALVVAMKAMMLRKEAAKGSVDGGRNEAMDVLPVTTSSDPSMPAIRAAYNAIKAARARLEEHAPPEQLLTNPALAVGTALHSAGFVELEKGIYQTLMLAYSPAWRLPLQAAVAAVAESMAPGGPAMDLVMQLMGEMKEFGLDS